MDPPEPTGPEITVYRTKPRLWAPFDDRTRGAFIDAIRNGLSKKQACAALQINPSKVYKWLGLGSARSAIEYNVNFGRDGRPATPLYGTLEWSERRSFYLEYNQALAAASGITKEVKLKAALGYVYEDVVTDDLGQPIIGADGQPLKAKKRVLGDWRAAEAIDKQRERDALLPDDRRLRRAQANKEEQLAIAAKAIATKAEADAQRAQYQAELARRSVVVMAGKVYFASAFLEEQRAKRPDLYTSLLEALRSDGYELATEEDAMRAAETRDPKRDEEAERLERLWSMGDIPPSNDEDVS